ncbi:MAG: fused MFS/spermidine synthase [Verrucomicrobiae bacterium]|nr:fused MFS/spermidine synthase [Verrucomicrobiae bacterium]
MVTTLYALTLALGSALLFAAQPMVARMALPGLGGSPAVWNTSMVFFQAALLAGYALAHGVARRSAPAPQALAMAVLLVAAILSLPIALVPADAVPPPDAPVPWLLARLALEAGPPAVALAMASPLLQRWFTRAAGPERDPYFLYAAGNVGSFGALLSYPFLVEPLLTLEVQARYWSVGFGIWSGFVLLCALAQRRQRVPVPAHSSLPSPTESSPAETHGDVIPLRQRLIWIFLAAVPVSLLQGCTLSLTTDVASVPLLWIVPLAIYLLTYVAAFATHGRPLIPPARRALPFLAVALLFVVLSRATEPVGVLIGLHLAFLAAAGLVCHGALVSRRPPPAQLTGFYLAIAFGGLLGGAFNALLAPLIFSSLAEYPLAIAIACAALPRRRHPRHRTGVEPPASLGADLAGPVALAGVTLVLGLLIPWAQEAPRLRSAIVFGLPAIAACAMMDRPRRLVLSLLALFLAGSWLNPRWSGTEYSERSFFGVTRVTRDATGGIRQLMHGNTLHGRQFLDPDRRGEPLAYYHREGPLGRIFAALRENPGPRRIGVIGLGVGTMAAYAEPGDIWTFFEIDPAVIRVARDPARFTFLADCQADDWRIIEGDARLRLREEPDAAFDLILLDAFSSDAIPVHLITREALSLYRAKLRTGGWLAAHISNRYLTLEPVFAALARDAGWICRAAEDVLEDDFPGKEPSHWVVLAAADSDLGSLPRRFPWLPAGLDPRVSLWTDQRSSVFEVFQWR